MVLLPLLEFTSTIIPPLLVYVDYYFPLWSLQRLLSLHRLLLPLFEFTHTITSLVGVYINSKLIISKFSLKLYVVRQEMMRKKRLM